MKNAIVRLNNYQVGARLKTMPTHKIIREERIDRYHTEVEFIDVTDKEIELIGKCMGHICRVTVIEK